MDEDVGNYELHYHGMVLGLNFISCESRGDEINAVNYGGTKSIIYEWHEQPDGTESDVAVDVAGGGTLTVDDENGYNKKSMLSKFGAEAKFTVRADDTGVWLTHNGSEVTGSKKAWKDLVTISASTSTDPDNRVTPLNGENTGGIDDEDWTEKQDIAAHDDASFKNYRYYYMDDDGTNDTYINFAFSVADNISKKQLIAGIDGIEVTSELSNSYTAKAEGGVGTTINDVTTKGSGKFLTFEQEVAFGRNFSEKNGTLTATDSVTSASAADGAALEFSAGGQYVKLNAGGNEVNATLSGLQSALSSHIAYAADAAVDQLASAQASEDSARRITSSTGSYTDRKTADINLKYTNGETGDEEKAITISAARDVSVDAPNVTADFAASSSGKDAKAGGKYMDETEYSSNRKSTYDTAYNNKKSALTSSDQAVRQADSDYNTCQKARTDAEAAERTKLINGLSADEKTAYDNARAAGKSDDEALQAAGVSISSIASQGETAYQAAVKTAAEKAGTNAL